MSTLAQSVRSWVGQDIVVDRRARVAIGVLAFGLATAFGAQIAVPVPFTPVPITLQTLFVILAGVALGPRAGAASMALYVGAGAMGAPVFSNGGAGLPWLLGPTGGYLLMYPASAFIVGTVAGRNGAWLRTVAALTLGVLTQYAGGLVQLAALTGEPLAAVVGMGALPFLLGDAVKIMTAAWLARGVRAMSFRAR